MSREESFFRMNSGLFWGGTSLMNKFVLELWRVHEFQILTSVTKKMRPEAEEPKSRAVIKVNSSK